MGADHIIRRFTKIITNMNQKEEMLNEGGGGAGSTRPSNNESEKNEWLKFVAFTAILTVLATCIILAVL